MKGFAGKRVFDVIGQGVSHGLLIHSSGSPALQQSKMPHEYRIAAGILPLSWARSIVTEVAVAELISTVSHLPASLLYAAFVPLAHVGQ